MVCEVALICERTDITCYINKSAYGHILNEKKDFDLPVKIFRDFPSLLPYFSVYIYHFYMDT